MSQGLRAYVCPVARFPTVEARPCFGAKRVASLDGSAVIQVWRQLFRVYERDQDRFGTTELPGVNDGEGLAGVELHEVLKDLILRLVVDRVV